MHTFSPGELRGQGIMQSCPGCPGGCPQLAHKLLFKICKLDLYNLKYKIGKEQGKEAFLVGVNGFQGKRAGLVMLSFKR